MEAFHKIFHGIPYFLCKYSLWANRVWKGVCLTQGFLVLWSTFSKSVFPKVLTMLAVGKDQYFSLLFVSFFMQCEVSLCLSVRLSVRPLASQTFDWSRMDIFTFCFKQPIWQIRGGNFCHFLDPGSRWSRFLHVWMHDLSNYTVLTMFVGMDILTMLLGITMPNTCS